jgi:hypothetical protein
LVPAVVEKELGALDCINERELVEILDDKPFVFDSIRNKKENKFFAYGYIY